MSKKTVTFKMPAKNAPGLEEGSTENLSPGEEQMSPVVPLADGGTEHSEASDSDAWVRRREVDPARPQTAAPSFTLAANGVTIDLTADRNFHQAAALMLLVPPMLSWFWFVNSANRYWNRLS